ncbi:AFL112Wp [Eremothecium gossypii ATCC 10895]|uniref:AFL112Wp n=1 Tax=Eremothecium gossypii (strain ATCC 10895 / CBS 109.51 / FGSC 9923 / NRRL Y-1056) TaxID=284811 RepID=Q755D5_EREGS|nr:AFL112Wp [Eremothecium gossypii ATCC 10895]AAS53262.2 AFL112Wp [Eremothecium gossypii ATCC 10895]AEY97572.1 FAFL112Wp [Eremothecium gossypii FDAG1]
MVLYKRKPIVLPTPKPLPANLECKVWHINETGEWFLTYQEYLERLDFYTRHYFTCEITGTSCLTFFDALNSEESQFKNVEERFPLKLREPVARFLHFNEVRRLDLLVEQVYAKFKTDFFPGEVVYLRKNRQEVTPAPEDLFREGEVGMQSAPHSSPNSAASSHQSQSLQYQKPYVVKEKAHFNAIVDPETKRQISPAYSKYMLVEEHSSGNTGYIIADQSQIYRDRSSFTKHLIKCFCKITLRRASSKMGAPWCVKEDYLPMYGLTMDWPVDMLKYKEDQMEQRPNSLSKRAREEAATSDLDGQIQPWDHENESYDAAKEHKKKVKKDQPGSQAECPIATTDIEVNPAENQLEEQGASVSLHVPNENAPITSIMEDLKLPFVGQHQPLSSLMTYSRNLDAIPHTSRIPTFRNFEKVIQCYAFLNTFNEKLCISNFTWENFITTFRCTDVKLLSGKVVLVNVTSENTTDTESGEKDSDIEVLDVVDQDDTYMSADVLDFIKAQNNEHITYSIEDDDSLDDEYLDAIKDNGSALLVECFVSLLRLFIDEQGDWKTLVMENWYDEEDEDEDKVSGGGRGNTSEESTGLNSKITNGNASCDQGNFDAKVQDNDKNAVEVKTENLVQNDDHEITTPEIDTLLDKCLTFRKINWSERLTKRQFQNGFWLIVLLGVYQDCMHLPMYTKFIHDFIKSVVPKDGTSTQLNKTLWRNFCRNLDVEQKVTALWILVDLCSNFSHDIKAAVEDSMELCGQIRSERYKIGRDLKVEYQTLTDLQETSRKLAEKTADSPELMELEQKMARQEDKIARLQEDKSYLDRVLCENDLQRLKPLGMDRYGNKYYWLELHGITRPSKSEGDTYRSLTAGRIWIQGPNSWDYNYILGISEDQISQWLSIRLEQGSAAATRKVFGVYRAENGSYWLDDESSGQAIELVDQKGALNYNVTLTALQKKIIDETPDGLLLSDSQWYCINSVRDYKILADWWENWGRREHDLLRQVKNVETEIMGSLEGDTSALDTLQKEKELMQKFKDHQLTPEELQLAANGEQKDQEQSFKTEDQLEQIAEEIMKLDDSSKTRKILDRIKVLEAKRDELLAKKQHVEQHKPGSRIQLRSEYKRQKLNIDQKLRLQEEVLTELVNFSFSERQRETIEWENERALNLWGFPLVKGASGKTKVQMQGTVDDKLSSILKNTLKHQDTATAA